LPTADPEIARVPHAGLRVEAVEPESAADRAGIVAGDRILSVSGKPVHDLLDLFFLTGKSRFPLEWRSRDGERSICNFRLDGEQLGIHPEPVRVRKCRNRCIFCFVHQLPKDLRRTLYVKDEDVRLSFLHGQYVTMTDVTDEEMARILRYRLSPLYVSIHATDAALRRRMLGNPHAKDILDVMRQLVRKGITIHGQIVVCPGINDGPVLERTLSDLMAFRPGLATVAVVPVGLTAHRKGLPPLRNVTHEEAASTIGLVDRFRKEAGENDGEPFVMAADEYYLLAGRAVPGRRFYGGFSQIENGVGLIRSFLDEANALFRRKRLGHAERGGVVVTGLSPAGVVGPFLERYSGAAGAAFDAVPVPNRLMGPSVTVTGLVSGSDIVRALKGKKAERLFVPSVMLRDAGDLFLDGMTPADLARATRSEVVLFDPTPAGFHDAVISGNSPSFR
jgi:putative radical SAM enzyme (TIGR03279 family)